MNGTLFTTPTEYGHRARAWVWVILAIAGLWGAKWLVADAGEWHERGSGKHVVYVTAVEKEGMIWATWKVYVKTDLESTQEEYYCVRPSHADLIPILEDAAEANARIEISYIVYLRTDWSECESTWSEEQGAIVGVRRV